VELLDGVYLLLTYIAYIGVVLATISIQKWVSKKEMTKSLLDPSSKTRRRSSSSIKSETDVFYDLSSDDDDLLNDGGSMTMCNSLLKTLKWPAKKFFKLLLPSPKKYTFFVWMISAIIIGGLSWCIVTMVQRITCLIGMSNSVFGMTVLAISGELPDLLMSVAVAKKGLGHLAIGLSFGDNILSITVGNGLAWLASYAIGRPFVMEGSNTSPLIFNSFVLLLCSLGTFVAFTYLLPQFGKLSIVKGWLLVGAYTFFLAFFVITKGTGSWQ
jgi:Ca2+/Na+ antiporter